MLEARVSSGEVEKEAGSSLSLDRIELEGGAGAALSDPTSDTLLLVHAGGGTVTVDGAAHAVEATGSVLVRAGEQATLDADERGARAIRCRLDPETDLHAPMGGREVVVALDHVEPGKATGARSFQVLHGPHNGSTRATAFVGYIPPGRAPWHYHLYDEIVWVIRGSGALHIEDRVEPLAHGSAFRLHPREVHIVENLDPVAELVVLGFFTPAGSPSAAYLTADVAASYAIASSG